MHTESHTHSHTCMHMHVYNTHNTEAYSFKGRLILKVSNSGVPINGQIFTLSVVEYLLITRQQTASTKPAQHSIHITSQHSCVIFHRWMLLYQVAITLLGSQSATACTFGGHSTQIGRHLVLVNDSWITCSYSLTTDIHENSSAFVNISCSSKIVLMLIIGKESVYHQEYHCPLS